MKALLYKSRRSKPRVIEIQSIEEVKEKIGDHYLITAYPVKSNYLIASVKQVQKQRVNNYNRWNIFGQFVVFKSSSASYIDLQSMTEKDINWLICDDFRRQIRQSEKQMLLDHYPGTFASLILQRKTYQIKEKE